MAKNDILFVTSYSKDIYEVSGRRLLESFQVVGQKSPVLVCYEQQRPDGYTRDPYLPYDLAKDSFLQDWLEDNKDVIPDYLGGTMTICKCKDAGKRHSPYHSKGCYWHWMNRNASRWFRKIASMRHAFQIAETMKPEMIVWLDADSYLIQKMPVTFLEEQLDGSDIFYFRGHREAAETGVICFRNNERSRAFLAALCYRYVSKEYQKHHRWDDGYQFTTLTQPHADYATTRDLVHPTKWNLKTNDVVPTTPIKRYLVHAKGRNSQYLDIIK